MVIVPVVDVNTLGHPTKAVSTVISPPVAVKGATAAPVESFNRSRTAPSGLVNVAELTVVPSAAMLTVICPAMPKVLEAAFPPTDMPPTALLVVFKPLR